MKIKPAQYAFSKELVDELEMIVSGATLSPYGDANEDDVIEVQQVFEAEMILREKAIRELTYYLKSHEIDIATGENDFGSLRKAFATFIGEEPSSNCTCGKGHDPKCKVCHWPDGSLASCSYLPEEE